MRIPRTIAYPPVEAAMLDWWGGVYDHVFIAFHPMHVPDPARPDGAEDDLDWLKARRPVRWSEVAEVMGEPCDGRFHLALWTATLAAERADADAGLVARLERQFAAGALAPPGTDVLPPALEVPVGAAFARLGVERVTVWDEERGVCGPLPVAALSGPGSVARHLPAYGPFALHAPEAGMLVTSGAEDIASLIALTDAARAGVDPEAHFEGIWAGPGTYCDWINPVDAFERAPRPSG